MIELHERLSEFSYGYGVTREVTGLLEQVGVTATPFLPSLIHENQLGFDVAFDRPGSVVMLQFKLGQEMERFRPTKFGGAAPALERPFWRFQLNAAEAQFRLLVAAQHKGAEVYYVAPRFSSWSRYSEYYQAHSVIENSLLISPLDLAAEIRSKKLKVGKHRVVYDKKIQYLCSEPIEILEYRPKEVAARILDSLRRKPRALESVLEVLAEETSLGRVATGVMAIQREAVVSRAKTRREGLAAFVALRAWALGAQAIFVTDPAS